jgi:hypothetical protein
MAADTKTLIDPVSPLQSSARGRIGVWEFSPRFRNPSVEPGNVSIRARFIGLDHLLFPETLSPDSEVCILETQTLFIGNEGPDPLLAKVFKGRHERFRPNVSRVGEVGQMPVVRVFPTLLGEIGTCPG